MLPIRLVFRELEPSAALTAHVQTRADKLPRFFDRILACSVAVDAPHRHQAHGRRFRVRVDLLVPGDEIIATSGHSPSCRDPYAAVDAAFKIAERALREYAAREDARDGDISTVRYGEARAS
jgi:ribosomal subunit interface protein